MNLFTFEAACANLNTAKIFTYLRKYVPACLIALLLLNPAIVKAQGGCAVTGTASGTPSCTGSSSGTATVTLSGSGSGAPGTYSVDGGASQPYSTNPFTITGLSAGNHIVVATVTEGGCVSSNIAINIPVSVLPLPSISASATTSTICSGSSSNLTGTGATTYTWMPGSLNGATVSVSPVTTTTYTVTGTNADGCAKSNSWAKIATGGYHTLAIKTDGTLWAWGNNLYGQVGDGTSSTDRLSPLQIGTANDWVFVSAGNYHSFALKANGTLWAWGFNTTGQLGDGSTTNKNIPVQIGTATDWVSISAGGSHTLGIKTNGTIWGWGLNSNGQIGDGTGTQRNSPVQIGTASNWASISGGSDHTLAIKTDGTLWAWGRNIYGQLGDGTTALKANPTQVGTATNWAKVSGCFFHSLAVKTDGTLWAWGSNMNGELGDGTLIQKSSPIQVGTATNWVNVEGGIYYSLGIRSNGTVWGWGMNGYGQVGDGTTVQKTSPVQVGTATNWNTVTGGIYHSAALKADGTFWVWGYNMNGQLGDGTLTPRINPIQVNTSVVSVTVTVNPLPTVSFSGLASSYCQTSPSVTLTGTPASGIFSGPGISGNTFNPSTAGAGTHTINYTYTDVNGCSNTSSKSVTVNFTQVLDYVNLQYPGNASFCQGGSLTVYGQIYEPGLTEAAGAGAGVIAELGYSSVDTNPATWTNWQSATFNVQVGNNDEYMSTLTLPAGTYYYAFRYSYVLNTCGYQYGGFSAGGGNSWDGINYISGVLTVNALPTVTVSASYSTICSGNSTTLTASGASSYNWMPGSLNGAVVVVSPASNTTYTITGTSAAGCTGTNTWATISAGAYHNMGLKTNGTLWVSGSNSAGQIGDGTTTDRYNAVQIGSNNWAMVSAGGFFSLGIKTDGTLWAWGQNVNGQLGDGTTVDKHAPVQIGTANNWATVSAGASHSLAMKTDGTLWGWGRNDYGMVGDGTGAQKNSPVQIGTANNWANISAGGNHSIALKKDGTLWAWGRGGSGQIGDGAALDRYSPVQVGTGTNWKKIAAAFLHSLAIKTDGTLWTWGRNMNGQIGDGTTTQRNTPVQIGTGTDWANVEGGLDHSIGIKTNGTVWAWGSNGYGQLGDGTTTQRTSPVQTGASTNWMLIDGGSYHSTSVKTDGTLYAWGRNMEGQLGDGTLLNSKLSPVQIGTTTVSVTITVNPSPVANFSGLGTTYCSTDPSVTLTGTPAGGTFSGPGIIGNTFDPSIAGAEVHTVMYTYTNVNGCSNSFSQPVTVNTCITFSTLNLNLFFEGHYSGSNTMNSAMFDLGMSADPTATDDITVNLWSPSNLSNAVPDYSISTILHNNGMAIMQFPAAVAGNSFYIAVKQRNNLETWSKLPVMFTGNTNYDFSTGLNKAYDDGIIAPMKNMGDGVYAFYTGDINQDGAIDGQDMNVIDNEVGFFGYNVSDLNGDGATDSQDMNFVDNNSQLGLFYARPY